MSHKDFFFDEIGFQEFTIYRIYKYKHVPLMLLSFYDINNICGFTKSPENDIIKIGNKFYEPAWNWFEPFLEFLQKNHVTNRKKIYNNDSFETSTN